MSFCDYGTLFEIHLSFENLQQFLETFGVRLQSNRPQCKYCRENGMCEDSDSESAMESSDADVCYFFLVFVYCGRPQDFVCLEYFYVNWLEIHNRVIQLAHRKDLWMSVLISWIAIHSPSDVSAPFLRFFCSQFVQFAICFIDICLQIRKGLPIYGRQSSPFIHCHMYRIDQTHNEDNWKWTTLGYQGQ